MEHASEGTSRMPGSGPWGQRPRPGEVPIPEPGMSLLRDAGEVVPCAEQPTREELRRLCSSGAAGRLRARWLPERGQKGCSSTPGWVGATRTLACRPGRASASKAFGTPPRPTRPVSRASAFTLLSASSRRASRNSRGV